MSGLLWIVGTPIGNLEELSPRAARVLGECDALYAEDTRAALKLLQHIGVRRSVASLFEGNEAERSAEIAAALQAGRRIALISEAGMPGISDPGARVVAAAAEVGARVEIVGGPSACLGALVGSGLPTGRFFFAGFVPRVQGARHQLLGELRGIRATLIFFEAPDRVAPSLAEMANAFGPQTRACLSREISKVHEEHRRGTLNELAAHYVEESPRGECVIVVDNGSVPAEPAIDIERQVQELLHQGLGPKDIADRLMISTGKSRRALYQLALALHRQDAAPKNDLDQ